MRDLRGWSCPVTGGRGCSWGGAIGSTPWPGRPLTRPPFTSSKTSGRSRGYKEMSPICLLTNSAFVIRVQMRGEGGSCGVSANENSCAHHMTWSPNKLWRSTFIFNLWVGAEILDELILSVMETFLGTNGSLFARCHFRAQKSLDFQGPPLPMALCNPSSPHQNVNI
jgi:hypothetical protein